MKTITALNFKGMEFTGTWNEKIYKSTINGKPELIRIYINNEDIHVTKEEFDRIVNNDKEAKKKRIDALIADMSYEEKEHIFKMLLGYDLEFRNEYKEKNTVSENDWTVARKAFLK